MGTRSITILRDADTEIAVLYRQHDGYPSGHGADIAKALGGKQVTNGISADDQINGASDMAVQLIAWLKQESTVNASWRKCPINSPGGFYLYPAGKRDCGEEYVYTLTCTSPDWSSGSRTGELHVKCEGHGKRDSFEGRMDEFVNWIDSAPCNDDDG